jgi:hypothetical protein
MLALFVPAISRSVTGLSSDMENGISEFAISNWKALLSNVFPSQAPASPAVASWMATDGKWCGMTLVVDVFDAQAADVVR